MTTFDDRENAFEARFARDADVQFRVDARRNKLLGMWAADKLGLTPAEADAYAKSVVQADFEEAGEEDVFRKVYGDLAAKDSSVSERDVRIAMDDAMVAARKQIMETM